MTSLPTLSGINDWLCSRIQSGQHSDSAHTVSGSYNEIMVLIKFEVLFYVS